VNNHPIIPAAIVMELSSFAGDVFSELLDVELSDCEIRAVELAVDECCKQLDDVRALMNHKRFVAEVTSGRRPL